MHNVCIYSVLCTLYTLIFDSLIFDTLIEFDIDMYQELLCIFLTIISTHTSYYMLYAYTLHVLSSSSHFARCKFSDPQEVDENDEIVGWRVARVSPARARAFWPITSRLSSIASSARTRVPLCSPPRHGTVHGTRWNSCGRWHTSLACTLPGTGTA